jgi:transposase
MYCIRQEHLFSLEQLLEMSPREKYSWIFEALDITPFLRAVTKKNNRGAPETLNYAAMIYSLFIRIVERMPCISDLVKRLKSSEEFRYTCRFTGSDSTPSKSAYSRLIAKLQGLSLFEQCHDKLIKQAYEEGFIDGKYISIDATHIDARDAIYEAKQRSGKTKKGIERIKQGELAGLEFKAEVSVPTPEKAPLKKRGRKKKTEREQWLREQEEIEANKTVMEKSMIQLLDHTAEDIVKEVPVNPAWGTKKNTKNHKIFWYGYKGHFAIDSKSNYILSALFSSANMNDGKMAIPLIKTLATRHPYLNIHTILADAGYDYEAVYQLIWSIGAKPLIDYNPHSASKSDGKDVHFRPLCKEKHAYNYDSFDEKYRTLKYTKPKECELCPFKEDGCQKVFKVKIDSDIRKYTVPARGSQSYKELYKKRTSVERVNAYTKEFFQLNNIRHCGGSLAKVDFDISYLVYTLSKLAVDRINKQMQGLRQVS